jgi:hypothetical protein
LYSELKKLFSNPLQPKDNSLKIVFSFFKYLLRMSLRPTPFGLFSGVCAGKVSDKTNIEILSSTKSKRVSRLDMNFFCAFTDMLSKDINIKSSVRYFPNTSLYRIGDKFRYVECVYKSKKRVHQLVSVDHNDILKIILKTANEGATTEELVSLLKAENINESEALGYVDELISNQVLISELQPDLSGLHMLEKIQDVFERIGYTGKYHNVILRILDYLKKLDEGIAEPKGLFDDVVKEMELFGVDIDRKYLFQLDMIKECRHCTISRNITRDILSAARILKALGRKKENPDLRNFREAFVRRYESAEIPLLQALDNDIGIGYGPSGGEIGVNPLVDDVVNVKKTDSVKLDWNSSESFYLKKYLEALTENKYEVNISEKDMKGFDVSWDDFPDTFAAMVRVLKNDSGHEIILNHLGGSGAANLIARFCHTGPELLALAKEIVKVEGSMQNDAIIAEIIHLPQSRTGNILCRPPLREYEIPLLTKSSVSRSGQIPLDDILISVINNKIILRSEKMNKRIIPRLSTAHNYSRDTINIYRFLCDLQFQDKIGSVAFDWGVLSKQYTFLPRVRYKNIILFEASWNIFRDDLQDLLKVIDEKEMTRQIEAWRTLKKIPERVFLCDNDNKILIDFSSLLSVRMFVAMVKKRNRFLLKECLCNIENSIVTGSDGSYASEFIIPFYKNNMK